MTIALRAGAIGCLLALLLGAGACDAGPAMPAPSAATTSPAPGSTGFFGGTDLAWVEITIAMNEEMLPLLNLAPTHSTDPAVKALAAEAKAFHERELTTLRRLHDQAKLPAENPHEGMPMPGMMTPELVTAAAATRGPAFDKLLVQHLKAHFEQGVKLAESEQKAGVEPQTRALATKVRTSREQHLPELATL